MKNALTDNLRFICETQQLKLMPHSRKFNWRGFVFTLLTGMGASLLISLEDNVLTNIEILRAFIGALVGALGFFQARFNYTQPQTLSDLLNRQNNKNGGNDLTKR